jgi:deoxycytidylate deaminase
VPGVSLWRHAFSAGTQAAVLLRRQDEIYSAGVTILASFPKECRFLTKDAVLLVHERHMETTIDFKGSLETCMQIVREQQALLEAAQRLEVQGFTELAEGSSLSADELLPSR